ncbi:cell division protein ZapC [Klebsiella pneumoniae subsp. pneumoniae]|nr:cell division protein ZapC [Klebsiella pneumoniae subsp. pneumoniae]
MRIKPDDNWRWYYDEEHDRMMLDPGQWHVISLALRPAHADSGCLCPFGILR